MNISILQNNILPQNQVEKIAENTIDSTTQAAVSQRTDSVEISQSGYDALEKSKQNRQPQKMSHEELAQQLEQANESAEATADAMQTKIKCIRIAAAIIAGHKVTNKDKKFLLENDSKLYMKAEMLRQNNAKAKKIKQISPDDEDKEESADVSDIRQQLAEDEIDTAFENAADSGNTDTPADSQTQ